MMPERKRWMQKTQQGKNQPHLEHLYLKIKGDKGGREGSEVLRGGWIEIFVK